MRILTGLLQNVYITACGLLAKLTEAHSLASSAASQAKGLNITSASHILSFIILKLALDFESIDAAYQCCSSKVLFTVCVE